MGRSTHLTPTVANDAKCPSLFHTSGMTAFGKNGPAALLRPSSENGRMSARTEPVVGSHRLPLRCRTRTNVSE